jgi:hypothetical protein
MTKFQLAMKLPLRHQTVQEPGNFPDLKVTAKHSGEVIYD